MGQGTIRSVLKKKTNACERRQSRGIRDRGLDRAVLLYIKK